MGLMNRLGVARNEHQGSTKRVLCVCSAGVLRSPTAAHVLSSEPFCLNTRSAGVEEGYALIPVDQVLIAWADTIVCMEGRHEKLLRQNFGAQLDTKDVHVLGIPDEFPYRDPELVKLITQAWKRVTGTTA